MSNTNIAFQRKDYPPYTPLPWDTVKLLPPHPAATATNPVATKSTVTAKPTTKTKQEVSPCFSYKHMAWTFVVVQVFYWRGEEALDCILTILTILCYIVCYVIHYWLDDLLIIFRTLLTIIQILFFIKGLLLAQIYGLKLLFSDEE
ncbi:hypothetical protein FRC06_007404 [Ceratobasidium sp. 370]|nr:hypothetical protein FRC06_007404 [Ceratobasidium sp. 370]